MQTKSLNQKVVRKDQMATQNGRLLAIEADEICEIDFQVKVSVVFMELTAPVGLNVSNLRSQLGA